jgi:hypothetical protein
MNKALDNVSDWLKFNRISLNISKSNFLIFNSKYVKDTQLMIDNVEIERVNEIKYLGVLLDDKLKFNKNGELVMKKLNKKLGFLRRNGYKMNKDSRVLYYKSLVQPHLDYCSFVFNMMDNGWLDKFQIVQNKFLKAMIKKDRYNMNELRTELNIVEVTTRININVLKQINRLITKELPLDLVSRIKTNEESRNRVLRHGKKLRVPDYISSLGHKSFFHDAISKFNELQDFVLKNKLSNENFINNCIKFFKNKKSPNGCLMKKKLL